MNETMQTFNYDNNQVRTIMQDGEPWFVLKDVCEILGLDTKQLKKVADRLENDEKGRNLIPTPGGKQESWVINESGLYSVILRSDKPQAKPFRRWVTHEVLPTIRKTGSYTDTENKFAKYCPVSFERAKATMLVQQCNRLAGRSLREMPFTWREIYIDFSGVLGYNINDKAKEQKTTKISFLEKAGLLSQFIIYLENTVDNNK
jgi:prophage antirepressor-like protein|nr:MAG TPA: repressor domain protein [Caudoviricetes sp.]